MIKAGFLLIFLLLGPALAGQIPDVTGGPINSSEISGQFNPPSLAAFVDPGTDSQDLFSEKRGRVMQDKAALAAELENLSRAYSQKHNRLFDNRTEESCNNSASINPVSDGIAPSDQITNPEGRLLNRLDINVRGISVRAINTVEGGSATATSNIIIEPVQRIELSSQARDKLR